MADDFGTDFAGTDDIDANWMFNADPMSVLAESLVRSLQMPRGALWYDTGRGFDIRSLIADTGPDTSVATQSIETECLNDERVKNAKCQTTDNGDGSWTIAIAVTPNSGATFTLTLNVSAVSVAVLSVAQGA